MSKARSILLLLAFSIRIVAQSNPEATIDAIVSAEMQRQKIPGVSLAVVKDGKPLIVKG